MIKGFKVIFLISISFVIILKFLFAQDANYKKKERYSIIIKSKALVLGPKINLGDIGTLIIPDSAALARVASINLGKAPPPGESKEITLQYIKKCLMQAGLNDLIKYLNGPRVIRVITAPIEIEKTIRRNNFG